MDMSDAIALSHLELNQDWINEFIYLPEETAPVSPLTHSTSDLGSPGTTSPVMVEEPLMPGMGLNMYPMYQPCPYFYVPQPVSPPSPVSTQGECQEKKLSASEKKKLRELARNLTCYNCGTQKTPLWRRTMDKKHSLCNACSLYERQHKKPRPIAYKDRNPRAPKRSKEPAMTIEQVLSTVQNACQQQPPEESVTLEWGMLQQLLTAAKK